MLSTKSELADASSTRPWPADRLERWPIERLIPVRTMPGFIAKPTSTSLPPPSANGDGRHLCWSTRRVTCLPATGV